MQLISFVLATIEQVPVDLPLNTKHPSTARGIAHVRTLVDEEDFIGISSQLTSVIGSQPAIATATETVWYLDTPIAASQPEHEKPQLILSVPREDSEHEALKIRGPGIHEVAFWVDKDRDGGCVCTPYGRIVWLSMRK
jgi:hypothetical protein